MNEEWIDKLFQKRETQEKVGQQSEAVQLEKRRRFVANIDPFRKWLSNILGNAIEGFNKRQKDPKGRIEYNVPPDGIISAHKGSHPSGNLEVSFDTEGERIICAYYLSRSYDENPKPTMVEYYVAIGSSCHRSSKSVFF